MSNPSVGIGCYGTERNRLRIRRNADRQRWRNRDYIRAYKTDRGCIDCGFSGHPVALDFDHRPGEVKSFAIGNTSTRSLETLIAEIAKCDVVCANCHRIRTLERSQF